MANALAKSSVAEPRTAFEHAVIDGLTAMPKTLPCRYFYDAAGSALFEEITQLPEYYPTRAEIEILRAHAAEMTAANVPETALVEFGSGSSLKTEILLAAMPHLETFVPVDVSATALDAAAARLRSRFPALRVHPRVSDFVSPLSLSAEVASARKLGFFPGSTIGNLCPGDAVALLTSFRESLAPAARMLVGVDLKKEPHKLVLAYNDPKGVTARFNLNILARINREIAPVFDLAAFRHEALYNSAEGRIEMHLVSAKPHVVSLLGRQIRFEGGETIHTENSYKYSIAEFQDLAQRGGWTAARVWIDPEQVFSVHELVAELQS